MLVALAPTRQCVYFRIASYFRPLVSRRERKCLHLRVPKSNRVISLLQELFPEESKSLSYTHTINFERKLPRLALDENAVEELQPRIQARNRNDLEEEFEPLDKSENIAVLVIEHASKFLTEDDFRRVIPAGKHIDGWTYQRNIVKVVKCRDRHTLDHTDTYFMVFSSLASATAYKANAQRLHQLARSTRSNLLVSLPTGLAGDIEAQPTSRIIDAYTLFSPSQSTLMKLFQPPFPPMVKEAVDGPGYEMLTQNRRTDHEVLVTIEGSKISRFELKGAIGRDSRARGSPWATSGRGHDVRLVQMSNNGLSSSDDEEATELSPDETEARRSVLPKFIISFEDEIEARRFAMAWNNRDISMLLQDSRTEHQRTITKAEVVW